MQILKTCAAFDRKPLACTGKAIPFEVWGFAREQLDNINTQATCAFIQERERQILFTRFLSNILCHTAPCYFSHFLYRNIKILAKGLNSMGNFFEVWLHICSFHFSAQNKTKTRIPLLESGLLTKRNTMPESNNTLTTR